MSYAIGNVIYGVSGSDDYFHSFLLEEYDEDVEGNYGGSTEFLESIGFETLYSGSANFTPAYLGVSITRVSETQDIDLDELFSKLYTPEMMEKVKKEYQEKIKNVPPKILEYLGEPKFMIVWSTS